MMEMSAFIPISLFLLPLTFFVSTQFHWRQIRINPSLFVTFAVLGFLIASTLVTTGVVALLYIIFGFLFLWLLLLAMSIQRPVLFVLAGLMLFAIPTLLVAGAERTAEIAASILFVLLVSIVLRDILYHKLIEGE